MVALEVIGALVILALVFGPSLYRRRQANRAASVLGGAASHPSPPVPAGATSGIGAPNPSVPPPTAPPDQRVATSGTPVQLTICGLPAVIWQRTETRGDTYEGMRLSLIADAGVGLPMLSMFHANGVLRRFADAHAPTGIDPQLDERYKLSGAVAEWRGVLGQPQVVQALLAFPLESLTIMGGRLTLVSQEGVHLDPPATQALAGIAATIIAAIPPQLTGGSGSAPASAQPGTNLADPDAVVASVLARQNLSPEQQQAMLTLIRANRSGH